MSCVRGRASLRCIPRFQSGYLHRRGMRFANYRGHRGRGTRSGRRSGGCGCVLAGGAIEPRLWLLVMLNSCWNWRLYQFIVQLGSFRGRRLQVR
jgi:hypothetical protein